MIAQMNTQTPTFAPGHFGRITGTTKDTFGARSCMSQSKQFVQLAIEENRFAEIARALMLEAGDASTMQMFASIMKWHLANAAGHYASAITFVQAALDFNLTTLNRLYIENKLQKLTNKQETMRRFADELQKETTTIN